MCSFVGGSYKCRGVVQERVSSGPPVSWEVTSFLSPSQGSFAQVSLLAFVCECSRVCVYTFRTSCVWVLTTQPPPMYSMYSGQGLHLCTFFPLPSSLSSIHPSELCTHITPTHTHTDAPWDSHVHQHLSMEASDHNNGHKQPLTTGLPARHLIHKEVHENVWL